MQQMAFRNALAEIQALTWSKAMPRLHILMCRAEAVQVITSAAVGVDSPITAQVEQSCVPSSLIQRPNLPRACRSPQSTNREMYVGMEQDMEEEGANSSSRGPLVVFILAIVITITMTTLYTTRSK